MAIFAERGYWAYQYLLYIPIALISLIPIFIIVYLIGNRKSWNKPVPAAWRAIINITLIGGLKTETTENGRKRYFLFGHPVTPGYVRVIGVFAVALWLSLLATFWNFIVKDTEECRNGIDCFFANKSRIKHCVLGDGFNKVIKCYEFQFDFINGAGTAGGLLAIIVTLLYGQVSAQAWLEKKKTKSENKHKKWCFNALSFLLGAIYL